MPLMGSLYIGSSGLSTSQNALNTTAHNITNSDTQGYVRQQVAQADREYNLLSINSTGISKKQSGLGVYYSQVRQIRDTFLDKTYREENGRLSFYCETYDAVNEVETLLGELDGASFQESINDLWEAVQELSKDPSSSVVQGLLVQRANAFISDAQSVYQGLKDYQSNLDLRLKDTVNTMNDYGKRIKDINDQIRTIEAGGVESANDLRDERQRLVDELSAFGHVSYTEDFDNNLLVKIEGEDFVTPDKVHEIGYKTNEVTGMYDLFWVDNATYTTNEDGQRVYDAGSAPVYRLNQEVSTVLDSDIGKLKAIFYARGDHAAIYTDIKDMNTYCEVRNSTIMVAQAEFDQLIHKVTSSVNLVLEKAFQAGDGTYMSDGNGNALQLFHRVVGDVTTPQNEEVPETLFTVGNIMLNQELMMEPSKLSFVRADKTVDYDTANKLKEVFTNSEMTLNPTLTNPLNINGYYSSLVAQIGNDGSVYKSIYNNEQATVSSTENARQQVIGVSTDEELSNMVKFQNAYNASSRYINVISEMLEHLLNTLGR